MSKKRATLTDLLNDLTFKNLFNKFKLLSCTAFEYENLPDGILPRHIEQILFRDGKAIFFKDPKMSYMCLRAFDSGKLDNNGDPLGYIATGFNYHKYYGVDDCVIIENNLLRLPTENVVLFYVNKITESERTMDVNVKACKTPYIIACDDKDVLTFKRIFQQIDGNTPAMFVDKGLNLDAIEVLKTDAKFLGNEIMDYKKSVENELLTFLGFNNMAVDKKERVNLSEANSNNDIIESFADMQLKSREDAIKQINKKYGLDIKVKRKVFNMGGAENVENMGHNKIDTGIA